MPTTISADLLEAVLEAIHAPMRRPVMLRPRPAGLPHPRRRLERIKGVLRVAGRAPASCCRDDTVKAPAGSWP